jgi:hypothetical protein
LNTYINISDNYLFRTGLKGELMEAFTINRVSLGELAVFFDQIKDIAKVLPISEHRVKSYINNPRGKKTDIVLYYILNEGEIIAFRTLWADEVFTPEREKTRFAWCSGNWVKTEWRRKGLSLKLLNAAYHDWDGKLMFTNYAPESEKGYLKSGLFPYVIQRIGKRFFYKINLYEHAKARSNKQLLHILAYIGNLLAQVIIFFTSAFYRQHQFNGIKFNESKHLPDGFFENLKANRTKHMFDRDEAAYEWIFKYPWISNYVLNGFYPFSSYDPHFGLTFISFESEKGLNGKLILLNRNSNLKLVYTNCDNPASMEIAAKYISNFSKNKKINTLTLLDEKWCKTISKNRNIFWYSKKFEMNIYSTFKLTQPNDYVWLDGDGDSIFT